tara:strand:+ start:3280 stop:5376 length:2097 start_codon:yes stop_codon:yes gene_type:complete
MKHSPVKSINRKYRPEIDGLRAFAVIAVIINHFNKDLLPNGYLGVDIFFVISGYVITSSISNRESINFRDFIIGFYERRIKRLLPALIFFVLVTSILISFFNPNPEISLTRGMTSLFGLSNIYLMRQATDYFAQSTELSPFTHTWSLSVEEQFYLIFPIIAYYSGFGKKSLGGSKNLFFLLITFIFISLSYFIYLYPINQPAAYFLMPSRFWEMACGSVLFLFIQINKDFSERIKKIPSLLPLLIILITLFLPEEFAVESTLIVVISSILLIATMREGSLIFKSFTNKKIVQIGLMSYSLYLWHWSILSISRWTIGIHWWSVPIQISGIYLISLFSYNKIEKPFRKISWSSHKSKTIIKGLCFLIFSCLFILPLRVFKKSLYLGNHNILDNPNKELYNYKSEIIKLNSKNCATSQNKERDALKGKFNISRKFINDCYFYNSNKKPLIALAGDSHTLSMYPLAEKLHKDSGANIFSASRSGCAFPEQGKTTDKGCFGFMVSVNDFLLEQFKENEGGFVIATSYLHHHFGLTGAYRVKFINENKTFFDNQFKLMETNLGNYVGALKRLANKLAEKNASLVIVAPFPRHPVYSPETCKKQWFRPNFSIFDGCRKTKRSFLEKENIYINQALSNLEKNVPNIHVYNSFDHFCDNKFCYANIKGNDLYYDNNHLSEDGIGYLYPHFKKFLHSRRLLEIKNLKK